MTWEANRSANVRGYGWQKRQGHQCGYQRAEKPPERRSETGEGRIRRKVVHDNPLPDLGGLAFSGAVVVSTVYLVSKIDAAVVVRLVGRDHGLSLHTSVNELPTVDERGYAWATDERSRDRPGRRTWAYFHGSGVEYT